MGAEDKPQTLKNRKELIIQIVQFNKEWYGTNLPKVLERIKHFNQNVLWKAWNESGAYVPVTETNQNYHKVKDKLIPIVPNLTWFWKNDFEKLKFMRKHQYEIMPIKNLGFVIEPVKSYLPIYVKDQNGNDIWVGEFVARLKFLDDWYIISELAYYPLKAVLEVEKAGVWLSLWNTIEKALDLFLTDLAQIKGKEEAQKLLSNPNALDYYRTVFFTAFGIYRELDVITFDMLPTLREV